MFLPRDQVQYVPCDQVYVTRDLVLTYPPVWLQHSGNLVDFPRFVELFEEYYLSDSVADLGNFINGRLDFTTEETLNSVQVYLRRSFLKLGPGIPEEVISFHFEGG